jgi:hypothetical protein
MIESFFQSLDDCGVARQLKQDGCLVPTGTAVARPS